LSFAVLACALAQGALAQHRDEARPASPAEPQTVPA
jgi:hypothetical protein